MPPDTPEKGKINYINGFYNPAILYDKLVQCIDCYTPLMLNIVQRLRYTVFNMYDVSGVYLCLQVDGCHYCQDTFDIITNGWY
jgi:hypothetical protein